MWLRMYRWLVYYTCLTWFVRCRFCCSFFLSLIKISIDNWIGTYIQIFESCVTSSNELQNPIKCTIRQIRTKLASKAHKPPALPFGTCTSSYYKNRTIQNVANYPVCTAHPFISMQQPSVWSVAFCSKRHLAVFNCNYLITGLYYGRVWFCGRL